MFWAALAPFYSPAEIWGPQMTSYLIRRLVQLVPILLGVSLLVFMLLHAIPGDPARLFAGLEASEEDIAAIRPDVLRILITIGLECPDRSAAFIHTINILS